MKDAAFLTCVSISVVLLLAACGGPERAADAPAAASSGTLTAKTYNSGFADAHDTYNGMGVGSDGRIYYVLCSEKFGIAGQMYSFDPPTEKIEHLGGLNEACGEKELKAIAQGKSHVNFVESDGKLYFATHIGFYTIKDGMETVGDPPPGYQPYPGGHFVSYDLASRRFESLAIAPHREGILSMTMDTARGRIFGLTWPTGYLLRFDLSTRELKNLGPVSGEGEKGKGSSYRTLCRSLIVDPGDGTLYLTTSEGNILRYSPNVDSVEKMEVDLVKDYFGVYDPSSPGHMGYNWRQTIWYPAERAVYGVHGNSGYLFRFEPGIPRVEAVERITSMPSKKSGMFDQFSYGYLGFSLGPDGNTIHYLTGGPIYIEGRRVEGKKTTAMGESKGRENLHLVTYGLAGSGYKDHGAILLDNGDRPAYVNSIAVGPNGDVYTLSRITEAGRTRTDLIRIRGPFSSGSAGR
jgi:hypothetical protein